MIVKKSTKLKRPDLGVTPTGELYTLGCGEQGQLGRIGERFTARGGRRGLSILLEPDRVHSKSRSVKRKRNDQEMQGK